jgi:hypothetical protein
MLAIMHAVADAIGRGGEAKSQTFRDGHLIIHGM